MEVWSVLIVAVFLVAAVMVRSRSSPGLTGATRGPAGAVFLAVVVSGLAVLEAVAGHALSATILGLSALLLGAAAAVWARRGSGPGVPHGLSALTGLALLAAAADEVAASSLAVLAVVWAATWNADVAMMRRSAVAQADDRAAEHATLETAVTAARSEAEAAVSEARTAQEELSQAVAVHQRVQKGLEALVADLRQDVTRLTQERVREAQEAEVTIAAMQLVHEREGPIDDLCRRLLGSTLQLTAGTQSTTVDSMSNVLERSPAEIMALARIQADRGFIDLRTPRAAESLWRTELRLTRQGFDAAAR